MANAIELWSKTEGKSIKRFLLDTDTGTDGQGIAYSTKNNLFYIVTSANKLSTYKLTDTDAKLIKRTSLTNIKARGVCIDPITNLIFVMGYETVTVKVGSIFTFEDWHKVVIYDQNHTLITSYKKKLSSNEEYARDGFFMPHTRDLFCKIQPTIGGVVVFYLFPAHANWIEPIQIGSGTSETGTGIGINLNNPRTFFYLKAGAFSVRLMNLENNALIKNWGSSTIGKPRSCDDMGNGMLCLLTI